LGRGALQREVVGERGSAEGGSWGEGLCREG